MDYDQTISKKLSEISESSTVAIGEKANVLRQRGIDIISFAMGEPDFDTPENIKEMAIKAIEQGFTKYTPVSGIGELKDAIRTKLHRDNGLTYSNSEIIVSCGAKHSLFNISQVLFDQDEEVIIFAPYWVTYPAQVKLAFAKPVIIDTSKSEGFKLSRSELKEHITAKTKALILNDPCNPTGKVYTREELEIISEICLENNIYIISDEIYERITYDGIRHISIGSLGKDIKDITITVNGLSKAYSMTGWRIGYAAGPEKVIEAINKFQGQVTSNPNSIAQMASVEALMGPQSDLDSMRNEFQKRRDYIVKELNSIPCISCTMPKGAFYAFPNVSKLFGMRFGNRIIKDSLDFCSFLLDEAHVAVVSGDSFGAKGFVRFSYATSMQNIQVGIERIKKAIDKLE